MTEPFEGYARIRAASLGLPDLPLVVVPHPLADLSREAIDSIADARWIDVATALTRSSS